MNPLIDNGEQEVINVDSLLQVRRKKAIKLTGLTRTGNHL